MPSSQRKQTFSSRQKWWLAAITVAALVTLAVVYIRLQDSCLVIGRRLVMKQQGAVGCLEFWLYRYQTLIAGLFALAAAGVTVYITRGQLKEAQNITRIEQIRHLKEEEADIQRLITTFQQPYQKNLRAQLSNLEQLAHLVQYDFDRARLNLDPIRDFVAMLDEVAASAEPREWAQELRAWIRQTAAETFDRERSDLLRAYASYCEMGRAGAITNDDKQSLKLARNLLLGRWQPLEKTLRKYAENLEAELRDLRAQRQSLTDAS